MSVSWHQALTRRHVSGSASAAPEAATAPVEIVVAAETLFLPPGRQSRPKRIAIVLRGLPGSGKSAAARRLRELELAHGGEAPRVLSLDDYFVTVRMWVHHASVAAQYSSETIYRHKFLDLYEAHFLVLR